MSAIVGWGVIGCADIAKKTCQGILEADNARVVAVGSRDIEKANDFVKNHAPEATAYSTYDEVLKDDKVQVVYVPLPTAMKKKWVLKAAENKKHVLCEKPIALSEEDAKEMVNACEKAGVQFMDNTMMMHHARLKKIENIIDAEADFGNVKHVVSCFTIPFGNDPVWAESNIRMNSSTEPYGALGDLGWYSIRISQWAFNYEEPALVSCHYFDKTKDRVPITAHAILKYAGGRTATFDCSFKCSLRQWAEVVGEKRTVSWDDFVVTKLIDEASYTIAEAKIADKAITFPRTVVENGNAPNCVQHTKLIEHMSELVRKGDLDLRWPQISNQTQRIMMALHASAQENGSWTKTSYENANKGRDLHQPSTGSEGGRVHHSLRNYKNLFGRSNGDDVSRHPQSDGRNFHDQAHKPKGSGQRMQSRAPNEVRATDAETEIYFDGPGWIRTSQAPHKTFIMCLDVNNRQHMKSIIWDFSGPGAKVKSVGEGCPEEGRRNLRRGDELYSISGMNVHKESRDRIESAWSKAQGIEGDFELVFFQWMNR